jgi:uncharacterized protein YndB with AHSA1/START domain
MTDIATLDAYATAADPTAMTIQRLLPGPIDRAWAYLTESDLRAKWLASGRMEFAVDAPFTLTWRNDTLTDPPGERPEGSSAEHSMECRMMEVDPPRKLAFTFGPHGVVSFELTPRGERVLLTLVHSRTPNRGTLLSVSAGWHAHLDILASRLGGAPTEPFWDSVKRLRGEYESRLPA